MSICPHCKTSNNVKQNILFCTDILSLADGEKIHVLNAHWAYKIIRDLEEIHKQDLIKHERLERGSTGGNQNGGIIQGPLQKLS